MAKIYLSVRGYIGKTPSLSVSAKWLNDVDVRWINQKHEPLTGDFRICDVDSSQIDCPLIAIGWVIKGRYFSVKQDAAYWMGSITPAVGLRLLDKLPYAVV